MTPPKSTDPIEMLHNENNPEEPQGTELKRAITNKIALVHFFYCDKTL